jgi:hypothetical protein
MVSMDVAAPGSMRHTKSKLSLSRETVRRLDEATLGRVAGRDVGSNITCGPPCQTRFSCPTTPTRCITYCSPPFTTIGS